MTDFAGSSNDHPYFEVVQQFKEICAVDDAVAQACIERADGDLQNAIIRFLNGDNGIAAEAEREAEAEAVINGGLRHRVVPNGASSSSSEGTPTPPPQPASPGWFATLLSYSPVRQLYESVVQIFAFVFGLLGGFFPAITSPEEDIRTFREEFESKYADVEAPLPWQHSTYSDVLKEAKSSVRFLLVYLHNPSHQNSEDFVRKTLCTNDFKELIERNAIILWGTNVRTTEGAKVAAALHETTSPSLVLICMRDNRLACVLRVSGAVARENLLAALQEGVNTNQRFLNAILNDRAQRELNNRLRREQEAEYERALEQDRKNLAERRRRESEHAENIRREEEEERLEEEKKQRLLEIRARLREEVAALPEAVTDIVRVSVRFPCGSKFDRKFASTDSLEILFNATLAHEKCPNDFSLLSSYPRKELHCAPEWYKEYGTVTESDAPIPTFKDAGIESSVVIMVRDNQA
uniref:UBX domain-containing protein n=1 Tax=Panagrellus redivivus TaxID=6233 RepID=A0A7E4UQV4_PANRE